MAVNALSKREDKELLRRYNVNFCEERESNMRFKYFIISALIVMALFMLINYMRPSGEYTVNAVVQDKYVRLYGLKEKAYIISYEVQDHERHIFRKEIDSVLFHNLKIGDIFVYRKGSY